MCWLRPTNQDARVVNGPLAEPSLHSCRIRHVLKFVEPVDYLRVAVIKTWAPFSRRLAASFDEQAPRTGVFKLNECKQTVDRIPDRHVVAKIAE